MAPTLDPRGPTAIILRALEEAGPMSAQELHATYLPHLRRDQVSSALVRLNREPSGPRSAPKRVFICRWERDKGVDGTRFYPRAIYAKGDEPDAPKPPPLTQTQYNQRRHERKMLKRKTPVSVFDLARVVRIRKTTKPANKPTIRKSA